MANILVVCEISREMKESKIWIHVCICEDALSGYGGLMGSILHCKGKQHISKLSHKTL